jgi:hypothetical protein
MICNICGKEETYPFHYYEKQFLIKNQQEQIKYLFNIIELHTLMPYPNLTILLEFIKQHLPDLYDRYIKLAILL